MKCEEFLDSITGSENLSSEQKQHMLSCPSCQMAVTAATAFLSSRSSLSAGEKTSIASISNIAFNAPKTITDVAVSTTKQTFIKKTIAAIAIMAGVTAFFVSNSNLTNKTNKTNKTHSTTSIEIKQNKTIVIQKKINHKYAVKNNIAVLKDKNTQIKFSPNSNFVFTNKGLKLINGRANIVVTNSHIPFTISNGNIIFQIESATTEYSVNNGIVYLKVHSGQVKLIDKNVVKLIHKGETWKTPANKNIHEGVLLLSPEQEEINSITQ